MYRFVLAVCLRDQSCNVSPNLSVRLGHNGESAENNAFLALLGGLQISHFQSGIMLACFQYLHGVVTLDSSTETEE